MAERPPISVAGADTSHGAAKVAQTLQRGLTTGLQQQAGPLLIDRLQLQLPVGATEAEIAKAVTRVIAARKGMR